MFRWTNSSPAEERCCQCSDVFTKGNKKKRCMRCKDLVCSSCVRSHPDVVLPYMGLKMRQRVCSSCYETIQSRKSDFLIRDEEGNTFQTGADRVPDGLVSVSDSDLPSLLPQEPDNLYSLTDSSEFMGQPDTPGHKSPPVPHIRLLIILVGSRGDVQPYIGFALKLQEEGHHVRIATHEHHRDFVQKYGIEFFPVAGDPAELMEFMVENQFKSVQGFTNKITHHREWVAALCTTSWKACTTSLDPEGGPYRADVIMANPPSFVGIHLAEKLGVPLVMTFTMPWTPTKEFCSPFARTNETLNFRSYLALDRLIWIGIRSIVNRWRENELGLPPVRTNNFSGHRLLYDLKVPYIYCFSEQLLPKPKDWGDWIGVSGFFMWDTISDWKPDEQLAAFLEAGPPPVFVGFGSIVVSDPHALTEKVMTALSQLECRAIVQQGWAGITPKDVPDNVLVIGSAPHDWLFERCSAVVHHGGAGTTATGLRAGKPTVVVPFFGDQFFWGDTVARMKLGPPPVHSADMTADKLAEAIRFALQKDIVENARECGVNMRRENGIERGVHLLKQFLPLRRMACQVCAQRVAEISCKDCQMRMCYVCNMVIHTRVEGLASHMQENYQIFDWTKGRGNWWGAWTNALGDGGTHMTGDIGTGLAQAINQVSDGQGVLGKVSGVGKGLYSFTSGVLTGTVHGVTTAATNLVFPKYSSPKRQGSANRLALTFEDAGSSEEVSSPLSPRSRAKAEEEAEIQNILDFYHQKSASKGLQAMQVRDSF